MAVDIDSFKRDLDQLKNQRSVIQAKLDDANRHIAELEQTLKGMGFDSLDAAKEAYVRQLGDAEQQHNIVKQLMQEIQQLDTNVPTKDEVMERLNALSVGDFVNKDQSQSVSVEESVKQPEIAEQVQVVSEEPIMPPPVMEEQPVVQQVSQPVQSAVVPPVAEFVPDMFAMDTTTQLNNSTEQANNNGEQGAASDDGLDLGALLFSSL